MQNPSNPTENNSVFETIIRLNNSWTLPTVKLMLFASLRMILNKSKRK